MPNVSLLKQEPEGAFLELWTEELAGAITPKKRWRLHWGPSDIFISGHGPESALNEAIERAWQRFLPLLPALSAELQELKQPSCQTRPGRHRVAQRMVQATLPFAKEFGLFVTPMAAVAGSIAQELLAEFTSPLIEKVSINNGGDIAFSLAPTQTLNVAIHGGGNVTVKGALSLQGLATSGWGGRSFSLGIADSVTVVAPTAAMADAAATLIANAVNIEHSGISRKPANEIRDDHDLGTRLVTCSVAALPKAHLEAALAKGVDFSKRCLSLGLLSAALLRCQGAMASVGPRDFFEPIFDTLSET